MPTKRGQHDSEPGKELGEQIAKLEGLLRTVRQSIEISKQGYEKIGDVVPGGYAEEEELGLLEELQVLEAKVELAIYNHQHSLKTVTTEQTYEELVQLYREIFNKRLKP